MRKRRILSVLLVSMVLSMALLGVFTPSTGAAEPLKHTVKWGQTLSWIAWLYGVSVKELMAANNLTNANYIYQGQELVIPGHEKQEYVEHVVQPGESLLTIAARYGVSVWDIAAHNGIFNINLVVVGQRLVIPGAKEQPTTAKATTQPTEGAAELPGEMPEVQEAIIIASPKQNEAVSSPVIVTGWGSGFENTLAVDILDETGSVIGQGYVMVDAEFGQTGPFTGTISFTPPAAEQSGRVSVYSISPRDGAIDHLSSVTVKLQP